MKSARLKTAGRTNSAPYLWTILDDTEMKLCPAGTNMKYLFFNPEKYPRLKKIKGDRESTLAYPPKNFPVWQKHSIRSVGVAEHSKGYYHSRINGDFTDVLLVASGTLGVKFGGSKINVGRGGIVVVPPKSLVDTYVNRGRTVLYWLHLENSAKWNALVGDKISVKTPECFAELVSILFTYESELYSQKCSQGVLELLAESFAAVFGKIFENNGISNLQNNIEQLAAAMAESPAQQWELFAEAKKLGVSPKILDGGFVRGTSHTFPKYLAQCKMKTALKMVVSGKFTNAEIAEKIGYSNAYSFSKAFKKYYGASPKFFCSS